ncbi:hypothetical protein [Virgibacillus sp. L01]|uniref:hypothetical protein n=1 Tax=Virgibacillus sp. L01 TaxID=3457429 RepID=UPI003FD486A5
MIWETIGVSGTQISSSSVILEFVIYPSDKFLEQYKHVIENNLEEEKIYTPTLKNSLTFWNSRTYSNTRVKEQMVEDLLLELKWRTLKELSGYFDMYFFKNKLICPSIEVYKIKQNSCKAKYDENEQRNEFWDSIGMGEIHSHEISKDGYWQLFAAEKEDYTYSSVKLTCNKEVRKEEMFHTLDIQIIYFVKELAMYLLPILVMKNYTIGLSGKIAKQQKGTFRSIKKERPNYKKLINIRYEIERNLQIFKRFKNEVGENEFELIRKNVINILSDFESARPRFSNTPWGEKIMDNTSYLIEKTNTLSQNFVKIIDDTVKLLEIKTNNSLRKRTFWFTFFTVILSVVATSIASTSLYFQFSEENQQKIQESFSTFLKLFM